MSDDLDYDDIEAILNQSTEVDTHDYQSSDDPDDRVSIVLYTSPDGRYFRYITDVGMNSEFEGSLYELTWYTSDRPDNWTTP